MLWESPALITLVLSAVGLWWFYTPQNRLHRAVLALVCILTSVIDPRKLARQTYPPTYDFVSDLGINDLRALHIRMVLTLGAVVW